MMRVLLMCLLVVVATMAGLAGCPRPLEFCNEDAECKLGERCILGSCVDELDDVDAGVVACAAPLEGGTFRVCATVGNAQGTSTSGVLDVRPIASSPAARTPMTGGRFTVR